MQSFPKSCWIPKFNRRNFVDVKVMLSLSIKNLWTLLRTASQSWLRFVLFCLLEISYFRAQQIMSYTKEVRSFTILFVGLFKFTLMFDKLQLYATRLVFFLKVRSKLDSVFSLYQSQTQSTIPDLVKKLTTCFFGTFYLSSQKSVCCSMKRACQREKAPSFKPSQLNFTIEVEPIAFFWHCICAI